MKNYYGNSFDGLNVEKVLSHYFHSKQISDALNWPIKYAHRKEIAHGLKLIDSKVLTKEMLRKVSVF